MKPLSEHAGDAAEERLAELFRSAEEPSVDPFRKRRILVRIERGEARRLAFWLRPAVLAALLVSGTAAAAFSQGIIHQRLWPRSDAASSATATPTSVLTAHPAPAPMLAPPAVTEPEASPSAPAEPAAPVGVHAARSEGVRRAVARPRPGSEDPTAVVEAIQALRTEKDPSRAQTLLDDYLQSHPKGQLSEDALALSIEAASAKHDPHAADYARRYLSKFPHGRYRDVALRALSR